MADDDTNLHISSDVVIREDNTYSVKLTMSESGSIPVLSKSTCNKDSSTVKDSPYEDLKVKFVEKDGTRTCTMEGTGGSISKPAKSAAAEEDSSSTPVWIWSLIGSLTVAIVGGVVGVLVMNQRKKRQSQLIAYAAAAQFYDPNQAPLGQPGQQPYQPGYTEPYQPGQPTPQPYQPGYTDPAAQPYQPPYTNQPGQPGPRF